MTKRTGPKLALNNKKLKALFPAMMIAPMPKYIAYSLGISKPDTIRNWVASGDALMEEYAELLEPLDNIFSFEYEALFENRKLQYDSEFRKLYELEPEEKIPDRLRLEYKNFMLNEKRKFIEGNIERKENEILDEITLSTSEDINEEYKLYIKFARIFHRAKAVKEIGYLQNVDYHASSSKNVGLSLKMLQLSNREDFGEQQIVNHTGNIAVDTKSILSLALNWEKSQREQMQQIETKQENVIDVIPLNLIEEKKDGI